MKILLAEKDKRAEETLRGLLRDQNYAVHTERGADAAARYAKTQECDLVILHAPGASGIRAVRGIRAAGVSVPLILLSESGEEKDVIEGLDAGADDVIALPYRSGELLSRVRALLRRSEGGGGFSFADITIDPRLFMLICERTKKSERLSEREFKILELFLKNPKSILPREQIALKVFGYESEAEYNNVEVYLSFTRKKIARVGSRVAIRAVRGVGYELSEKDAR